ncbi:hypothetical protein [Agrobacterium tumefaciens]|uniref:SLAC1 family transporter n=1 Tax=Agrobacterium sp. NCPPB 925 TaxID=1631629 RepID=UPI0030130F1D
MSLLHSMSWERRSRGALPSAEPVASGWANAIPAIRRRCFICRQSPIVSSPLWSAPPSVSPDLGQCVFGADFFGWLAIESVLLHRLLTAPGMANTLRPTLGIQLAPPVVGAVSLIAIAPQAPLLLATV